MLRLKMAAANAGRSPSLNPLMNLRKVPVDVAKLRMGKERPVSHS